VPIAAVAIIATMPMPAGLTGPARHIGTRVQGSTPIK
jgi:hypothetical protein